MATNIIDLANRHGYPFLAEVFSAMPFDRPEETTTIVMNNTRISEERAFSQFESQAMCSLEFAVVFNQRTYGSKVSDVNGKLSLVADGIGVQVENKIIGIDELPAIEKEYSLYRAETPWMNTPKFGYALAYRDLVTSLVLWTGGPGEVSHNKMHMTARFEIEFAVKVIKPENFKLLTIKK